MEIVDDYSSDSTISNLSDSKDAPFIFDSEDLIFNQKPEEFQPKIQSVTSTLNLGSNLNLKIISQKMKDNFIEQNYKSSLIIKMKNSNAIITLFPNGKMVCSGARSEKEAKSICSKIAKIIKKSGFEVHLKDYKVQNISANYEINFGLNLNKLQKKICDFLSKCFCKFDKNIFPGLIIYIDAINLTIFETGKIVITGAKNKKDIEKIFKLIYPVLYEAKI